LHQLADDNARLLQHERRQGHKHHNQPEDRQTLSPVERPHPEEPDGPDEQDNRQLGQGGHRRVEPIELAGNRSGQERRQLKEVVDEQVNVAWGVIHRVHSRLRCHFTGGCRHDLVRGERTDQADRGGHHRDHNVPPGAPQTIKVQDARGESHDDRKHACVPARRSCHRGTDDTDDRQAPASKARRLGEPPVQTHEGRGHTDDRPPGGIGGGDEINDQWRRDDKPAVCDQTPIRP
jgi:hypothetical protein